MTNGPRARIAESVVVDIPRPRERSEIIHDPAYYAIRNHLVEFLVRRSKELSGATHTTDDGPPPDAAEFPADVDPARNAGHVTGAAPVFPAKTGPQGIPATEKEEQYA